MPRILRLVLILILALTALPMSTAPVQADPPVVQHEPFPLYRTRTFVGPCAFPVQQTVIDTREVATLQVDSAGNPRKLQVRGRVDLTETNLNTGKSLSFSFSTPVDLVIDPVARTVTYTGRGRALLFLGPIDPNLPIFPGTPGPQATLINGAWEVVFPQFPANTISFTTTSPTEDLCALLS